MAAVREWARLARLIGSLALLVFAGIAAGLRPAAAEGVSDAFDTNLWCLEAFGLMERNDLLADLGFDDGQLAQIRDYADRRTRREAAAVGMSDAAFAEAAAAVRRRVDQQFAAYLRTRNPDDLEVMPAVACGSLDFADRVYFDAEGNMAFAPPEPIGGFSADWRRNLWCRAAMRHMARETLFPSESTRALGNAVFRIANNAIAAEARQRGVTADDLAGHDAKSRSDVAADFEEHWPGNLAGMSFPLNDCMAIAFGDENSKMVALHESGERDVACRSALLLARSRGMLEPDMRATVERAVTVLTERISADYYTRNGVPFHLRRIIADRDQAAAGGADERSLLQAVEPCLRRAVAPADRVFTQEWGLHSWCAASLNHFINAGVFTAAEDRAAAERALRAALDWKGREAIEIGLSQREIADEHRNAFETARPQLEAFVRTRDRSGLPHDLDRCMAIGR